MSRGRAVPEIEISGSRSLSCYVQRVRRKASNLLQLGEQGLAGRPKPAQAMALRCHIVLNCYEGASNGRVARNLGSGATVCKLRERFSVRRLEGLVDEPKPARYARLQIHNWKEWSPDAGIDAGKSTHWGSQLMAKKSDLSQTAIVRIWHGFGLQSHRSRISNSP